jgi:hypothetical protein
MGKVVLLAIVAFGILATYQTASQQGSMNSSSSKVSRDQHEVLARTTSMAGYNVAKQRLTESFADHLITGTHAGGNYVTKVSVNGLHAKIESYGTILDAAADTVGYTILAEFEYRHVVEGTLPEHMGYALLSHGNIEMNGNSVIDVYGVYPTVNANAHTNSDIMIKAPNASVSGFGSYSGADNTSKGAPTYFHPNYNPDGLPTAYHEPTQIDIPFYDAAEHTSKVVVDSVSTSAVNLAGSYSLGGTREDPYVWHIQNDLQITGNTQLSGYTMFIVDGDIQIGGTVQSINSGYAGDESSTAFYAGGSVAVLGTIDIWGQIYANGNVTFVAGTPDFYGTITNRGGTEFKGTPSLHYRTASPALTVIWDNLVMIAYSEW